MNRVDLDGGDVRALRDWCRADAQWRALSAQLEAGSLTAAQQEQLDQLTAQRHGLATMLCAALAQRLALPEAPPRA